MRYLQIRDAPLWGFDALVDGGLQVMILDGVDFNPHHPKL